MSITNNDLMVLFFKDMIRLMLHDIKYDRLPKNVDEWDIQEIYEYYKDKTLTLKVEEADIF